jgi:hypothetical protein
MAKLILHTGDRVRVLDCRVEPLTFGRSEPSTVRVDDPEAAGQHIRIEPTPDGFMLIDLGSPQGTRVNGRLVKHLLLHHGDEIAIGHSTITFDDAPAVAAAPAPTARAPVRPPTRPDRRSSEIRILAGILIAALLVTGIAVLLPKLTEPSPRERAAEELFGQAQAREAANPAEALALYEQVPPEVPAWHARARERIARLREEIDRRARAPSTEEQRNFDELAKFWKDHPSDAEGGIKKGEEFLKTYPGSIHGPDVVRRLATLRRVRTVARLEEVAAAERAADRNVALTDFGAAVRALDSVSERYRNDIDVFPRITAKREAVADQAKRYFRTRTLEADQFLKAGKKRDAKDVWYEVSKALGDGQVPDFADLARVAAVKYDSIKP